MLWIERFATFEELRARVREFARDYNEHWLLERHGYRTPAQAREHLHALAQATVARSLCSPECPVNRGRAKGTVPTRVPRYAGLLDYRSTMGGSCGT